MLAGVLAGPNRARTAPVVDEEWIASRAGELIATVSESCSHLAASPRARRGAANRSLTAWRTMSHQSNASPIPLSERRFRCRMPASPMPSWASLSPCVAATVPASIPATACSSTPAAKHSPPSAAFSTLCTAATAAPPPPPMSNWHCRIGRPRTPSQPRPGRTRLEMATSGRRVALALAPAGTGKTTAMAALAHAWRNSGGHVIGLAPTADAAIVLGRTWAPLLTPLDKYVWSADPNKAAISAVPDWLEQVGPDTLIIVDEAGQGRHRRAGRDDHRRTTQRRQRALVGDDGQLSSISAGGVLRDIAEATDALTLSEVVRFKSPAEAAAGLALHDADPAGIGFYIDHHASTSAPTRPPPTWPIRHGGPTYAGADSILLAPTNDVINELNARACADRLAADPEAARAATVVLADQLHASVGDTIRTRKTTAESRSGAMISFATATATPSPKSSPMAA